VKDEDVHIFKVALVPEPPLWPDLSGVNAEERPEHMPHLKQTCRLNLGDRGGKLLVGDVRLQTHALAKPGESPTALQAIGRYAKHRA
jgi:hypothetical protein